MRPAKACEGIELVKELSTAFIVAHFHEWLTGIGLILLRTRQINIATVFTTHATVLGRRICAKGGDFYNNLKCINSDKESGDLNIFHLFCIERAAVHSAHVFTTVSHVTGLETQYLLGRIPEVILPNGLNLSKFCALHEFQNLHSQYKAVLNKFTQGHFYGHLNFDLNETLYFFIAGRNEYSNKGVDLYLEALARLNYRLKKEESEKTVIAFIIMPGTTENFNVEALHGQAIIKQITDTVAEVKESIGKKIYNDVCCGLVPKSEELLSGEDIRRLKQMLYRSQRTNLPPVCTHNLSNSEEDKIILSIREKQLFNNECDRVKVVYHPEFLCSASPLLPLEYEHFVRGCHLGVFPSYYEPWGYTPAECTVLGVPSVTSNLSGFGCFIEEIVKSKNVDPADFGIYIVDRRFKALDESLEQLVDYMHRFTKLNRRERINLRYRNERLSQLLSWTKLCKYYKKARDLALRRTFSDYQPDKEQKEDSKITNLNDALSPKHTPLYNSIERRAPKSCSSKIKADH
ncbi:glycogen [starch] synthase, muscle-like [Zophobas morio]|uniref:glycogen [starch] synthase, muscle-like n=1 Tax=Zophobas morio TaxID=2755281 RepID=UPI00308299CF